MSRLRELRLHGFKTFADPTRFVFQPGVNALIGPNGSGKSNMADAVRWVLGEQSNRSLRTRRADDVIFAGSQHRRPQGMAEAILTLDNEDGWLPLDFAEVTVGRRAFRSGESEYLVNGSRARLRDVVELLGEGRLGANELVVVGQGTVDAALSLRPEERRQLFEEAAGVKNLQVRKNEALARLGHARDNLTRVTDLLSELRPQVRRLAQQAQHQQEHESLVARARALVGESHRRRDAAARAALGEARRQAAAAEAALEALRAAQVDGRRAVVAAEERYWSAEQSAREAAGEWERTREARIRAESRLEALAQRVEQLRHAEEATARELAEVEAALRDLDAAPVPDHDTPAADHAAAAEAAWRTASDELAAADAALLAAEEALADARREHGERIAAAAQRGEVTARAEARRRELRRELEEARRDLAAAEAERAPLAEAARMVAEDSEAARLRLTELQRESAAVQPRVDEARRRASELAERAGALRGELEALHERAERGRPLGSMLSAAGWTALLDTLEAPAEAWPAIEAVVGGELEGVLIWRDGDLIDRLADARGAARLLAAGTEAVADEERAAALKAVGASQTLSEWTGVARGGVRILGRVAVAPDLAALLGGWRSLPPGWLAVTPRGDLADGRGLVAVRGRADAPGGEAAQRHIRRRELAEALERLEEEQARSAAAAAREMAALSALGRALDEARARLESAQAGERSAGGALEGAEARQRRARDTIALLNDELARLPQNASEVEAPAQDVGGRRLEELETAAEAARRSRAEVAERRAQARDAWIAAQSEAQRSDERQMGHQRERATLEARQMHVAGAARARSAEAEALARERIAAEQEVAAARETDEQAAARRAAADRAREDARAELRDLERQAGGGLSRLAELERATQSAAVDASRQEDALTALERERQLALDSLPAASEPSADEVGQPPPPDEAADEPGLRELDDESLDGELRRVRRTLAQIGSVNPFAVEEHREMAGRMDELSVQETDLTGAIAATEELIGRLDGQIAEQFNAAFEAIGERFDEFCRLLFAGGSASLQLGEGEDGEAPDGIEIVVRPPGKRLQRLAMLSGGERALTGVALLFAMLSVNPVPFCILDEVDAALDEANIGRFADALRRLSETIDFVVITHNRATIEVADTIYGVTMTDAAVSQVVSLRLADLPAEATA